MALYPWSYCIRLNHQGTKGIVQSAGIPLWSKNMFLAFSAKNFAVFAVQHTHTLSYSYAYNFLITKYLSNLASKL
ncbi:MAG: hypothetical protein RL660_871 [Bacteroidota bacterium]|jgi:hypothetical protein